MNTKTHNKLILHHLNDGNTITGLEALRLFGCFRLSARIFDLRKLGNPIQSRTIRTIENKKISEYFIVK